MRRPLAPTCPASVCGRDGTMPQAAAPDSGEATASPDPAEDFYALGEFFPSFEDYAFTADAHLARDSRSPRASGKACDVPLRRGQTRSSQLQCPLQLVTRAYLAFAPDAGPVRSLGEFLRAVSVDIASMLQVRALALRLPWSTRPVRPRHGLRHV